MRNKLSTAYVTQWSGDNGKTDWIIFSNEEKKEEKIGKLPGRLTEAEVFEILDFARKFELIAFNNGIDFQKGKASQETIALQQLIKQMNSDKKLMKEENIKLADTLDRVTQGIDS